MAQKSEKTSKQELRAPDAFQLAGLEAQTWLAERQKLIGTIFGVLLLAGLIAALVNHFSKKSEERAAKELGAALMVLDRPVVEGENPAPPPADPARPPFKSAREQDEALVKALTDFREKNKGTEAGTTAALPLGKAQLRLGNHDAALNAFGDFLKDAPKNDPLRVGALEGQGYAYEAQGKFNEALASFEQMSKEDAGGYLAGMGQYHRARMLILQGKKDEAAKVLSEIPTAHPNTAAARLASERQAVLAAQGVKIPPPPAAPAATPTPTNTQEAKK